MTRERDIERVLDAWLLDGPAAMPDRVYDNVLDRVDRQPQRRRARIQLRFRDMPPITRFAAAAAIVIVVLGASYVALGRTRTPEVGTASPAPSSAPSSAASIMPSSPAPSIGVLPPELVHSWIGAPRSLTSGASSPSTPAVRVLHLGDGAFLSVNAGGPEMASSVTRPAPDTIRFTGGNVSAAPCIAGAVGDYRWSLSANGMTLRLTPLSDGCAARSEALAGPWTRSACLDPSSPCLGVVPGGTYVSSFFDPYRGPDERPAFGHYARFRYTVPDGWANADDQPMAYELVPTPDYPAVSDGGLSHGIHLYSGASAASQAADCASAAAPGAPTTLEGLTSWIATHPGVTATTPSHLTVGGHPATMTDLRIAPDWTVTCPDAGSRPMVLLLRQAGPDPDGWSWGLGTGERQRVILVDLGNGHLVLIGIDDDSSPSRFDELVQQAMPVIQSFDFQ